MSMLCAIAWGMVDPVSVTFSPDFGALDNFEETLREELKPHGLTLHWRQGDQRRFKSGAYVLRRVDNDLDHIALGGLVECCRAAVEIIHPVTPEGNSA